MASRYLCSFLPASYNHFQYQRFFFQFLQMQHGPKLYSSDCCLGSIKCLPHSFHLFGLFHVLAVRHKAFVNTCIQVFMSTRASFSLGFTPRNKTAASIPLILQGSQHVTSQSSCLQSFCQARSGISVGSLCPSLLRNGGLLPAAFQPPLLIKKKKSIQTFCSLAIFFGQEFCCTAVILALERVRQEDHFQCKASLGHSMRPCHEKQNQGANKRTHQVKALATTWQPEFNPQAPLGRRRELIATGFPPSSPPCANTYKQSKQTTFKTKK